jgi:hypothetical protein
VHPALHLGAEPSDAQRVATRERYVIDGGSGTYSVRAVCDAVFGVLDGSVETLRVDAYSDFSSQMPDDIRTAQDWLRARGFARSGGDPGISIVVVRGDDIGWAIARAYVPWSIRTSLRDGLGDNIATLDDGGRSITLNLTASDVAELGVLIGPELQLVPLSS